MSQISQKSLLYRFSNNIAAFELISKGDRIVVALSGGSDSVVLLDLLIALSDEIGFIVKACHFNHKMRGQESEADEKFVRKICQDRGIECCVASTEKKLQSEEEAREARYDFFKKILKRGEGSKIALAHNANDVAETFLMRISRGTGFTGLKSIPRQREKFIRPLLPFSKKEIENYAKEHSLDFVIDRSNFDQKYLRNFFRLKIIPLFESRNPNFVQTLFRSISHIERDEEYLEHETVQIFNKIAIIEDGKIVLKLRDFLTLHPAIQYRIVRKSLEKLASKEDIGTIHLDEIMEIIKKGRGKKHKQLPHSLLCEIQSGRIVIYKA